MNNELPAALKRSGFKQVTSNRSAQQDIVLKPGVLGLFFGDELAEALLKRQQNKERAHG